MTQPALFREEALAFQADRLPSGQPLQLGTWTRWFYWLVLILVVAGLLFGFTTTTDRTATGPARVNVEQASFQAVLPDAAASSAQPGREISLTTSAGPGNYPGRISSARVADAAQLRAAGFDQGSSIELAGGVLVTGRLLLAPASPAVSTREAPGPRTGSVDASSGRLVLVIHRGRLLTVLLDGFTDLLGGG